MTGYRGRGDEPPPPAPRWTSFACHRAILPHDQLVKCYPPAKVYPKPPGHPVKPGVGPTKRVSRFAKQDFFDLLEGATIDFQFVHYF